MLRRYLLAAVLLATAIAAVSAPKHSSPTCKPLPDGLSVDRVWGGTRVSFASVEAEASIYVGYYDAERWLSVSRIDKCTGRMTKVRLPSRFEGWDAHNSIVMALGRDGRLHVAGNMHVAPLVYARMETPGDMQSLATLRPMIGTAEDRATYPSFFRFPDGGLGFSYRQGQSGEGREIINRFVGERWERWLDQPLFASAPATPPVSAYHTGYVKGPDGKFHVAWVWRQTRMVETNFNVNYARSADLKNWENSTGRRIPLPMTPLNAEIVDPIAKGQGLLNNLKLGFDSDSQPIISYLKFDPEGNSQLWHARLESDGWTKYQSTRWNHRWDPRGGGTIPAEISFSGVEWRDGMLVERVRHPALGVTTLKLSPSTLQIEGMIKEYAWDQAPKVSRKSIGPANVAVEMIKNPDGTKGSGYAIAWPSMPADTRDQPRTCKPEVADCGYSFDLTLHKLPPQ